MSNEFESMDTVPSLTLEPELEEKQELTVKEEAAPVAEPIQQPVLTEQEQKMVSDFAAKIDLENTTPDSAIRRSHPEENGRLFRCRSGQCENPGPGGSGRSDRQRCRRAAGLRQKRSRRGIFGFFKKQSDKLELMKSRYAKAEVNVEKISDALQQHQVRLLKDSAVLDKMYEQNLAYFKELTMYIMAGKQKLQEVREGKLKELEATAQRTGLAEDAQAARDLAEKCNRFEKKIYDLELTRTISIQTAPQIRMIQNNDTVMVEKIQTTLVNTIPLWKNQMVLALGIAHSTEAAQAQRQVNDVTNALLKHNAEKLHMASVETAKEAERGIVDIETLKKTNADLIQTLDDVMKIQSDGRAQRMAAEAEMAKMEEQLKTKLLQIRSEKQG